MVGGVVSFSHSPPGRAKLGLPLRVNRSRLEVSEIPLPSSLRRSRPGMARCRQANAPNNVRNLFHFIPANRRAWAYRNAFVSALRYNFISAAWKTEQCLQLSTPGPNKVWVQFFTSITTDKDAQASIPLSSSPAPRLPEPCRKYIPF